MGVTVTGQYGFANQHLAEDAARHVISALEIMVPSSDLPDTPYINSGRVLTQLQQQLRRSIPSRDDKAGVFSTTVTHGLAGTRDRAVVVSGQSEIGNLQYALVVDEQIGGLHVSM